MTSPQPQLTAVAPVPSGSGDVRPYANITGYRGARVDVPTRHDNLRWGLTYEGPAELLFKSLTLSRYDPDRGLLRGDVGPPKTPYPPYSCKPGRDCIRVSLRLIDASGSLSLPLPTGFRLDARSLRLNGRRPAHEPTTNGAGEAMLDLGEAVSGTLTFEAGPARQPKPERPAASSPLPTELRRRLERLRHGGRHGRARAVTALVREEIAYDITPGVAQAFSDAQGRWHERVFAVGAGDCDIKNGVNVLALRSIGIPARMAIGIPARAREARSGLHAWTEYYAHARVP